MIVEIVAGVGCLAALLLADRQLSKPMSVELMRYRGNANAMQQHLLLRAKLPLELLVAPASITLASAASFGIHQPTQQRM